MDEEGLEEAKKQSFVLSDDVKIVDVIHPYEPSEDEEMNDVLFYRKGYSDRAVIHIENDDEKRFSFVIEPFLPGVEIRDGFVGYDNL